MRKVLYLFSQLRDKDVEWLSQIGQTIALSPNQVLIQQGVDVDSLFIVLDGTLSVTVGNPPHEVAQLICGEVVGEMSLVEARPPSATVSALSQAVVFAMPKQRLQHQLQRDSDFAAGFYRALSLFLASRLRSTVGRLGYGMSASLDEEQTADDELDLNILDHVHLAGARFDRLLKRALRR